MWSIVSRRALSTRRRGAARGQLQNPEVTAGVCLGCKGHSERIAVRSPKKDDIAQRYLGTVTDQGTVSGTPDESDCKLSRLRPLWRRGEPASSRSRKHKLAANQSAHHACLVGSIEPEITRLTRRVREHGNSPARPSLRRVAPTSGPATAPSAAPTIESAAPMCQVGARVPVRVPRNEAGQDGAERYRIDDREQDGRQHEPVAQHGPERARVAVLRWDFTPTGARQASGDREGRRRRRGRGERREQG